MLRVGRDTISFELLLAIQHLLPECFEIHLHAFGLGQHLAFFFLDVVPHTLGKDGELCVAVIIAAAVTI